MKFTSACYLCLTVVVSVIAYPNLRQETALYPKIKSYCTSFALKTVLHTRQSTQLGESPDNIPMDIPSDLEYMTSGITKEIPFVTSGFEGDYSFDGNFDGARNSRQLFEKVLGGFDKSEFELYTVDKLITKLAGKMMRLKNACISKLLHGDAVNEDDENDAAQRLLAEGQFEDDGYPMIMPESRSQTDSANKRSDLGLNPTGWRKRRSGDNDERLQHFLRNVRQLLEKRKRLEFNPTGW